MQKKKVDHFITKSVGEPCVPSTFLRPDLNSLWPCLFDCRLCMHILRVSTGRKMISLRKSHVNLVLLNYDYRPVVSYPFLYISALWGFPTNKRLFPVDVWLPITPDLPSCFLGKEGGNTQGDDNQESTHHGDSLEKQEDDNNFPKLVKKIRCKIKLVCPGTRSTQSHMRRH